MQILNNNPIVNNNGRLVNNVASVAQDSREAVPEQTQRVAAPVRVSSNGSTDIDTDELQRRSEQLQQSRVQRLNDIESAPLSTQQALNIYQETNQAGEAFEFGELVGVDLFV